MQCHAQLLGCFGSGRRHYLLSILSTTASQRWQSQAGRKMERLSQASKWTTLWLEEQISRRPSLGRCSYMIIQLIAANTATRTK